jgi:hypothetical protein
MSIFGQCHLKWVGQSDSITKGAVIGGAGTCSVSLLMVLINRDCGRRWGTAKATGRRYCYGGIWRADERGAGRQVPAAQTWAAHPFISKSVAYAGLGSAVQCRAGQGRVG